MFKKDYSLKLSVIIFIGSFCILILFYIISYSVMGIIFGLNKQLNQRLIIINIFYLLYFGVNQNFYN